MKVGFSIVGDSIGGSIIGIDSIIGVGIEISGIDGVDVSEGMEVEVEVEVVKGGRPFLNWFWTGFTFLTGGGCNSHLTKTSCSSGSVTFVSLPSPSPSPPPSPSPSPSPSPILLSLSWSLLLISEIGSTPFLARRRAEPDPDKVGSCSSAQTTIKIVDCLDDVVVFEVAVEVEACDGEEEVEVEVEGQLGKTERINCYF